jgi:hypothetical protein
MGDLVNDLARVMYPEYFDRENPNQFYLDMMEVCREKVRTALLFLRGGPRKLHKKQPSFGQDGITTPWDELSPEVQKGLQLAAYIVRMYGDGELWADVILSRGEQERARWWMEHESREKAADV